MPSIFVVEAVHAICCIGSRLRKIGRISRGKPFWACKSGEREVGRRAAAAFVAFDKKKRLTVTWSTRCKRRRFWHLFPGNERCEVNWGLVNYTSRVGAYLSGMAPPRRLNDYFKGADQVCLLHCPIYHVGSLMRLCWLKMIKIPPGPCIGLTSDLTRNIPIPEMRGK
jgi:hypothetical protein